MPFAGPGKTKGGLILADTTHDTIQMTTVCGLVLKMGPLCSETKKSFLLESGAKKDNGSFSAGMPALDSK